MYVFYTKEILIYPTINHLIKYRAYSSPGSMLDTRGNDQAWYSIALEELSGSYKINKHLQHGLF